MSKFGKFLPSTQFEVAGEIFTFRLSRYWRLKLEKDYDMNVSRYYAAVCLEGTYIDEYQFGAVVWALLNGGGHKVSEEEACDFIDMAIKVFGDGDNEKGFAKLFDYFMEALSSAFMTESQFEEYKKLIEVYRSKTDEEEEKK
ncbi:hypothetical protein CON34_05995 [Bacillus thuringiensis]|uniref:hypothetical protein n=1 Tax=Bacillus thuringiensis TaxID=1428 RepID=UPI000BECC7D9|nr:hypothetical protein [Bacillus thuringiensis]PED27311.1 hypothetical protein CON34_05995 [Bacillus thuringiensis]